MHRSFEENTTILKLGMRQFSAERAAVNTGVLDHQVSEFLQMLGYTAPYCGKHVRK